MGKKITCRKWRRMLPGDLSQTCRCESLIKGAWQRGWWWEGVREVNGFYCIGQSFLKFPTCWWCPAVFLTVGKRSLMCTVFQNPTEAHKCGSWDWYTSLWRGREPTQPGPGLSPCVGVFLSISDSVNIPLFCLSMCASGAQACPYLSVLSHYQLFCCLRHIRQYQNVY